MTWSRGVGVLVVVLLVAAALAPLGTADTDADQQTVDALANEAAQQYETTVAAVEFARMPLVPTAVGGGLGLGIGVIVAAAYAYQNRGMR